MRLFNATVLVVFLCVVAYFGYGFLVSSDKGPQPIAPAPSSTTTTPAPSPAEKKTEAMESAEPKGTSAPVDVKKGVETTGVHVVAPLAKPKEILPLSQAKTAESSPAAVKAQETAAPAKTEVAVAKESTPPAVAAPMSLKMNIIGQRKEADGSYSEILVSEGSVLRSGDNFQIHLEPSRTAYVYILMYDSQGKAGQIFPDPKINQPGSVAAGSKLVVPARDLWFWLDENTGTETIYVLASEKPMTDIGGLLAKMEGRDDAGQKRASQEIKEKIAVMQRGVGGIVKGNSVTYTLSDGKKIQKVTDVVTGTGSVVRAVSFLHR
jgi:uncharacterized protein DUF4384